MGNLSKGEELSRTAKEALWEDIEWDIKQCLKTCEGAKFDYCNRIAKQLEEKK